MKRNRLFGTLPPAGARRGASFRWTAEVGCLIVCSCGGRARHPSTIAAAPTSGLRDGCLSLSGARMTGRHREPMADDAATTSRAENKSKYSKESFVEKNPCRFFFLSSVYMSCRPVRIAGSPPLLLFSSPTPRENVRWLARKGPVQMQARNTRRRALVNVATR